MRTTALAARERGSRDKEDNTATRGEVAAPAKWVGIVLTPKADRNGREYSTLEHIHGKCKVDETKDAEWMPGGSRE